MRAGAAPAKGRGWNRTILEDHYAQPLSRYLAEILPRQVISRRHLAVDA